MPVGGIAFYGPYLVVDTSDGSCLSLVLSPRLVSNVPCAYLSNSECRDESRSTVTFFFWLRLRLSLCFPFHGPRPFGS